MSVAKLLSYTEEDLIEFQAAFDDWQTTQERHAWQQHQEMEIRLLEDAELGSRDHLEHEVEWFFWDLEKQWEKLVLRAELDSGIIEPDFLDLRSPEDVLDIAPFDDDTLLERERRGIVGPVPRWLLPSLMEEVQRLCDEGERFGDEMRRSQSQGSEAPSRMACSRRSSVRQTSAPTRDQLQGQGAVLAQLTAAQVVLERYAQLLTRDLDDDGEGSIFPKPDDFPEKSPSLVTRSGWYPSPEYLRQRVELVQRVLQNTQPPSRRRSRAADPPRPAPRPPDGTPGYLRHTAASEQRHRQHFETRRASSPSSCGGSGHPRMRLSRNASRTCTPAGGGRTASRQGMCESSQRFIGTPGPSTLMASDSQQAVLQQLSSYQTKGSFVRELTAQRVIRCQPSSIKLRLQQLTRFGARESA
eukprot:NODE_1643_length_1461_cov_27.812323_g1484_i0.p1 GENE.NODE_1643_length_1461_cov_27.812323_g1484_i0~~NODE_1643_length_1461_cov_27.812323_g1484_i0.p1  ORF type:complete len:413 (+),score=65.22 NODE_1643_length_1461_cov_27.812323_g1484_i0:208-1446(+)